MPTETDAVLDAILSATLPTDEEMLGHYLQLMTAGASPGAPGLPHHDRLNAAVNRVLQRLGVACPAELVIAVVDGASVSALSEGLDVRATARDRLRDLIGPAAS